MHYVRILVEQWFESFPDDGKFELSRRFRSTNDEQHLSAFFELYCHAILRAHGFECELHPISADTTKRPDFLVTKQGEPCFLFEATSANESAKSTAAQSRTDDLIDAIDRMQLEGFYISVIVRKEGPQSLATKPIKQQLVDMTERMRNGPEKGSGSTRFEYVRDGWRIDFTLTETEQSLSRPVGMSMSPATWSSCDMSIASSLRKKGGRYGELTLPYVIAVNCADPSGDDEDVIDALFGKQRYGISPNSSTDELVPIGRDGNGIWVGVTGPRYTRVSAVLTAFNLVPWTIGSVTPTLWVNPFARRPFDHELWRLRKLVPNHVQSQLEEVVGEVAPTILHSSKVSHALRQT